MKQAILLVSFGTTHLDQLEKNIEQGVNYIARCFEGIPVKFALSSKVIIKKLKELYGKEVLCIEQAIEECIEEGCTRLFLQPLHLIEGYEYQKVLEVARSYEQHSEIIIGKSLCSNQVNIERLIREVTSAYIYQQEMILLLGHGTDHKSDAIYQVVSEQLKSVYPYSCVSTLKRRQDIPRIADIMRRENRRKVVIIPFMLVAGKHIAEEVMGVDDNKWEGAFRKLGMDVEVSHKGLGTWGITYRIFEEQIEQMIKSKRIC